MEKESWGGRGKRMLILQSGVNIYSNLPESQIEKDKYCTVSLCGFDKIVCSRLNRKGDVIEDTIRSMNQPWGCNDSMMTAGNSVLRFESYRERPLKG